MCHHAMASTSDPRSPVSLAIQVGHKVACDGPYSSGNAHGCREIGSFRTIFDSRYL